MRSTLYSSSYERSSQLAMASVRAERAVRRSLKQKRVEVFVARAKAAHLIFLRFGKFCSVVERSVVARFRAGTNVSTVPIPKRLSYRLNYLFCEKSRPRIFLSDAVESEPLMIAF